VEEQEELPEAIAQLRDDPAGAVILDAVRAHGGWTAWTGKESVEYDFQWTPYLADGSPGMTGQEHHKLVLTGPRIRGRVERPEEDFLMAFNGLVAWAARDGGMRPDRQMEGGAQAYVQRVHWVFRLPFNLVGRDVRLTDEGTDRELRKIKVQFPVGMGVLEDDWAWVFVDEDSGQVRELFLNAKGGRTWMEFLDFREVDEIVIPHRRRIFQVNRDGTRGGISHETELRNLVFNAGFEEAEFDPPPSYIPQVPPDRIPSPGRPAPGGGGS
jgi:hypothetical protein